MTIPKSGVKPMRKTKRSILHSIRPKKFPASALIAVGTLLTSLLVTTHTVAKDINLHPASCQAPFLNQAFPMRWHEFYLMNPASNIPTWVICPTTWDWNVVTWPAGGTSNVQIYGAIQSGASSDAPLCFFSAADRDNLELSPYISIPGGKKSYIQNLSTTNTPPKWKATGFVSHDSIRSSLGGTNPSHWSVSVFCQLPPGYAISNIYIQQ